jgi:hypothetical protein
LTNIEDCAKYRASKKSVIIGYAGKPCVSAKRDFYDAKNMHILAKKKYAKWLLSLNRQGRKKVARLMEKGH